MSPVTSTNTTATATEAIEQAFQRYLDVYFTQRDLGWNPGPAQPSDHGIRDRS
jgi:hypothetical protein